LKKKLIAAAIGVHQEQIAMKQGKIKMNILQKYKK
jgi:hypothetical protein